jgi:two-component system nitrogen regulation sensor histidine kinase NtrY
VSGSTVVKDKEELKESLSTLDHAVVSAALVSAALALILAIFLSRQLGRPLAELAAEARKVADGEARPLRVKGSGEIADLASAFATMLDDLAATRRRLAATDRVAAWREVARRVAHEVKNPLAPIRAAVETLRRLRARNDPAFDEYFDEATRTVLDEVHRIAGIVTEFTRFARLPAPKPTPVDALDLVQTVLRREQARAGAVTLAHQTTGEVGPLRADRDQITQILVNLVQNAIEALRDPTAPGESGARGDVLVVLGGDRVHLTITVEDSGPGIHADFAPRLFEPYATTKSSGTGLGLAIAQRIATDHGGDLSFAGTSRLGGAAFRLSLPREGPPIDSERARENNQL